MKRILCMALCVMMVLSLLAGCGGGNTDGSKPVGSTPAPTTKHTHDWSWATNESSHWKACSGCDLQANMGAHMYDNNDGVCADCGYVEPCEHSFDEERWISNAEKHWHPATCKHEGLKGSEADHVDENNDGVCDVCEYFDETHEHSYKPEWSTDENEHWHDADCGHTLVSDKEAHVDLENDGVCDTCLWFDETHTHTFEENWSTDAGNHWHAATCQHTGAVDQMTRHADDDVDGYCDTCKYLMCTHADFDVDGVCDICGYEDPDHTHEYVTEYAYDNNGHWQIGACHPGAHTKMESHVDKNNDGNCDVCPFVICTHTYKKTWSSDETHHWYQLTCTCSVETRKDYGKHVDADGINGCDVCLHGYQAPSPVTVVLNRETLTIDPRASMISWTEMTIMIPKPGRYLITSDNIAVRWYQSKDQENKPTSYASEIYFDKAGEVTLLAYYFDFNYKNAEPFEIHVTMTNIEDLVLNTSRGKAELPTMMTYKVVFEAMEVGTWTLTTSVDAVSMGTTVNKMEFTNSVEVVVEKAGDLVELYVYKEDSMNSSFLFDWELMEPFQLDVGLGQTAISVPPKDDTYKVVFTAPEDGQFLLSVSSDQLSFSEWGLGGFDAPVRTESMQQLTPVMKKGETFTTWIQTVYNYPESVNVRDTLNIINVGTMLSLEASTAAPSTATGSIYSFTAKESSYYKITVTNGEIGITTNGVTQWILPQGNEGSKVATYEVKLEKGETYVFQIRNSDESTMAKIDPVKYEIGLENMFDANGATLADMGKSYTANMVPSKLYDLTIPTEMLKLRVKLEWDFKGVTVYVDGEVYKMGTELYLQDVKSITAKLQNNENKDVKFTLTVVYAPEKVDAPTAGELVVNAPMVLLVTAGGQAEASFTAELGGTYTLICDTPGAVVYVQNAMGTVGEVVINGAGSYSFQLNAGEKIIFIIKAADGVETTVQILLTQGK